MSRPISSRILVIRRRYLGDLVLVGPVLSNLRLHFPDAHLALLVDEKYGDVQANNPHLDEILCIPQRQQGETYLSYIFRWVKLLQKLRKQFDAVYDITQNNRIANMVRWIGARHRVSYRTEGSSHSRDQRYDVLAVWPQQGHFSCHSVDLCLRLLEADGIPIATRETKLYVPTPDAIEARKYLQSALSDAYNEQPESTFVLVHPGARLSARRWSMENFAAVCDAIHRQSQAKVILLAGPGEQTLIQEVQAAMHTKAHVLEAPSSVPKLAALLQEADLFVCNDSGPMHVAAAVGTPVVALFGAQSTTLWHPVGDRNTVLQPSLPCVNCLFPGVCQPPNDYKMKCIQRISAEEVIAAVLACVNRLETGIDR